MTMMMTMGPMIPVAVVLRRTITDTVILMDLILLVVAIRAVLAEREAVVLLSVDLDPVAAVLPEISAHLLAVAAAALLLRRMELLVLIHPVPAKSAERATDSPRLVVWDWLSLSR